MLLLHWLLHEIFGHYDTRRLLTMTVLCGYLIRPCDGGGSIIHIVDHLNLEAWSVPEVLRPLYQSSKVVAQKMTIVALRYIKQIAQETSGEVVYNMGRGNQLF
ncbi:hypothetical protein Droror1_Dr00025035 [Drosera rotundifolia]